MAFQLMQDFIVGNDVLAADFYFIEVKRCISRVFVIFAMRVRSSPGGDSFGFWSVVVVSYRLFSSFVSYLYHCRYAKIRQAKSTSAHEKSARKALLANAF